MEEDKNVNVNVNVDGVSTPNVNEAPKTHSKKTLVLGLVALVLIAVVVLFVNSTNMTKNTADENIVPVLETNTETGEAIEENLVGMYVPYDSAFLEKADKQAVVLFFRASWCPTCKALHEDIVANISNIPNKLVILDVDYDSYADLKEKYGVTVQHTLVQVDKDGNMLQKWSGSSNLGEVVSGVLFQ